MIAHGDPQGPPPGPRLLSPPFRPSPLPPLLPPAIEPQPKKSYIPRTRLKRNARSRGGGGGLRGGHTCFAIERTILEDRL
eukprot:5372268-Pyramimonas_sp.AAC.1